MKENIEDSKHWKLNKAKQMLVDYLKADGYRFQGNDYQNMDRTNWSKALDVVRITCKGGDVKPRYLWAMKKV